MAEQSDPLFAPADLLIMTPTPSIEIPAQENLLQKHKEVEKLPQPDQLVKICTDARFPKTVEVGQYFMTKHTDEFLQFAEPVTLLEVTTTYLQGKHGVEIRIESVNKDNSHSWVRISHGLNKLVTDLIDREYDDEEQETSSSKTEVFASASRSKAKAKPRRPSTASPSSRTVPILERIWLILNQELNSIKLTQWLKEKTLLFDTKNYLEKKMGRSNSGGLKDDLQNKFENSQYWSDNVWKS